MNVGPTIVRGVLRLGQRLTADGSRQDLQLYDASGRRVAEPRPGENDVRHLPSGIYFVRMANGAGRMASSKVVVTR